MMHYTNWKWQYDILCVPDGIMWITGITKKKHNLTWNEENLDLWSEEIICVLFVKSRREYKKKKYKKRNNTNERYRSGKQEVLSCEICCLLKIKELYAKK